eukprot:TRINITY_DN1120_c1_g1_i5.p1 TRINITY_DN1120_c1_g1~~TRINITY_DN1120_c1_g1_i5.p1  ORF type:complete len:340 (-),score=53.31 TRINITY_DN1120_c1_g1_i5:1333-2352(-)
MKIIFSEQRKQSILEHSQAKESITKIQQKMMNILKRKASRQYQQEEQRNVPLGEIGLSEGEDFPTNGQVQLVKDFLWKYKNYKITKLLGHRSSGIFFEAEKKKLFGKNKYAIKIQLEGEDALKEAEFSKKFSQKSKKVIRIVESFSYCRTLISVFELATKSLRGEYLEEEEIPCVLFDICQALSKVHKVCVHNDIKPDNIIINRGESKLTGFGSCTTSNILEQGVGTPRFQCPEYSQHNGQQHREIAQDTSADIWSLGITLIALTGIDTYQIVSKDKKIANEDKIRWNFSPDLANLLIGMLQQEKLDRITLKDIQSSPFLASKNIKKSRMLLKARSNLQ